MFALRRIAGLLDVSLTSVYTQRRYRCAFRAIVYRTARGVHTERRSRCALRAKRYTLYPAFARFSLRTAANAFAKEPMTEMVFHY